MRRDESRSDRCRRAARLAAVPFLAAVTALGCVGSAREPGSSPVADSSAPSATTSAISTTGTPTHVTPPDTTPNSAASLTSTPGGTTPAPLVPPATPAPTWLGTRALGPAGGGPVAPQVTPPELVDRRIVTIDVLPPPTTDAFDATVAAVPAEVLARSTWQAACPVAAADLRYVTVAFWGFDERRHTGEVLLNADAVDAIVAAFEAMYAARFPLEEVRVIRADELDAAPTGDGNVTSAFVCRPVTGGTRWSDHAYGRAIDVNPFHNPYDKGSGADRVVLPELATAYTDRSRVLPGMITPGSVVAEAFGDAGWGWGGDYRSLKDWQHFSASGR